MNPESRGCISHPQSRDSTAGILFRIRNKEAFVPNSIAKVIHLGADKGRSYVLNRNAVLLVFYSQSFGKIPDVDL
jgi:hypothetical protein